MEFFNRAKAVRLRSHIDKYLVADDDEETVRQSHNGSSRKARWTVELVEGKNHVIRLKSCHGSYLSASDEPFLLGMTGKKVLQAFPTASRENMSMEWEPIREGYQVKLRAKGGKFLRANGATPPWRNSITVDLPQRTLTRDWVLWDVDVIDISLSESQSFPSYASASPVLLSFPSLPDSSIPNCASIDSHRSTNAYGKQKGMEIFDNTKSVRLQSHLGKYLVADDDEETVRQSRNGSSQKARWTVEHVEGKTNVIRLKSCQGLYLTATDEPFLLGMTGKKVIQTLPAKMDTSVEWEPVKQGFHVKLQTSEGKFLRANGGTPPWRNSITHDIPHRTATQDWVLWGVEIMDIMVSDSDSLSSCQSSKSSISSLTGEFSGSPDTGSPLFPSSKSDPVSTPRKNLGMEFFQKAKVVRLRSHHDKFLMAEDDQENVCQERYGSYKNAKWTVEFVEGVDMVVRLKSCFGKYLAATEEQFLLGVTGRKVLQTNPRKLDSSVEWEPVRDGFKVKLKTRYGNYLRANGGLPPFRNSITHDIPHIHLDWILWEVDVVEVRSDPPKEVPQPQLSEDIDLSSSSFNLRTPRMSRDEFGDFTSDSPKYEGRMIYYRVADDVGNVEDETEEPSFHFKGKGLQELSAKLEEETGLDNIIVCSRNPLNGKLYPLRLALPPNNATMHIVVVPATSKVAAEFVPPTPH